MAGIGKSLSTKTASATKRGLANPGPRFVCGACGEGWERHPATVVRCPQCGAAEGAPCKRPSGHDLIGGIPHVARERKAVDEGLLGMCPEGPTAKAKRDDAA